MKEKFIEFWVGVGELAGTIVGVILQVVGIAAIAGGIIVGIIIGFSFDPAAFLLIPGGLVVGPILMKLGMALVDWLNY